MQSHKTAKTQSSFLSRRCAFSLSKNAAYMS